MIKKPKITANALTKHIIYSLQSIGFNVWNQYNGGVYDVKKGIYRKNPLFKKGVPDVIGFHRKTGTFIGVEVKVGRDKKSMHQDLMLNDIIESGAFGFVARDYDQFDEYCKHLKNILCLNHLKA